jgi:cytochrome c556
MYAATLNAFWEAAEDFKEVKQKLSLFIDAKLAKTRTAAAKAAVFFNAPMMNFRCFISIA